jgi:hypothetical protein
MKASFGQTIFCSCGLLAKVVIYQEQRIHSAQYILEDWNRCFFCEGIGHQQWSVYRPKGKKTFFDNVFQFAFVGEGLFFAPEQVGYTTRLVKTGSDANRLPAAGCRRRISFVNDWG